MANRRTYSDDQLTAAVAGARSWCDVMEALGKRRNASALWIQRAAHSLGLDTSHFNPSAAMGHNRTYTDDDLRAAVAASSAWPDVMAALGKPRNASIDRVQRVADRIGLDVNHLRRSTRYDPVPAGGLPFTREPQGRMCSGLTVAARWFLERGHMVSVPLEPAPYDLVADSATGLKRIQVKSTLRKEGNGRYTVRIVRRIYDAASGGNAAGRYREAPYTPDEVDFFFVLAGADARYLIPIETVSGRKTLVLDAKYAEFAV
jgi:hypothetical protein